MNDILDIFNKEKFDLKFKKIIAEEGKKVENSESYEYMKLNKKTKRESEDNTSKTVHMFVQKGKKRGRPSSKNCRNYIHDKYQSDNIIKKIKAKLFKNAIQFLNNILNMEKGKKLLKLDYNKNVNKLKRDEDLKLINMPLKELFSKDISPKYNKNEKEINHNKKIIDNILNMEENINDYDYEYNTANFVLNIKFGDYIDIFTYKKSLEDLITEYGIEKTKINFDKINKNIIGIKEILEEIILKDKDIKYFLFFIFYLYNYVRWFCLKRGRQKK